MRDTRSPLGPFPCRQARSRQTARAYPDLASGRKGEPTPSSTDIGVETRPARGGTALVALVVANGSEAGGGAPIAGYTKVSTIWPNGFLIHAMSPALFQTGEPRFKAI